LREERILPSPDFDLSSTAAETQLKAKIILGKDLYDTTSVTKVMDEVPTVKDLLAQADMPISRCVGFNYAKHSSTSLPDC